MNISQCRIQQQFTDFDEDIWMDNPVVGLVINRLGGYWEVIEVYGASDGTEQIK